MCSSLWLWVERKAVGAQLHVEGEEEPKVVSEILDYDSATHHFLVEFTDGEITTIPDKYKFEVSIDSERIAKKSKTAKIKKPKK
ncbi:MAG: hypothetical protein M0Q88_07565 [Bacilli bacterium]|nr:hypothetical protein [Bacilli bacterium]